MNPSPAVKVYCLIDGQLLNNGPAHKTLLQLIMAYAQKPPINIHP